MEKEEIEKLTNKIIGNSSPLIFTPLDIFVK